MWKRLLPALCSFALTAVSLAQTARAGEAQSASAMPRVTGTLDGPRSIVFETPQDSCSPNDVPDAMARAFRDVTGTVHMVAASSDMYQNLGPTLNTLQHSCDAAFRSFNDPNPADFNDQIWLDSFYTLDGKTIAALSHTEYHGWAHSGECTVQGNAQYTACEYDSDTYHRSNDGGYHFFSFKVPSNFIAGFPYQYKVDRGPMGYSVDTNILNYGGWYYAVATSWSWPPNCSGTTGPHHCIASGGAPLRTQDVFDPSSWRGWNGKDFSVTFVDPYVAPVKDPAEHVYTPVPYMGFVNAINIYQPAGANVVVATLWDYWDNELGPPGLYLTTSTDLINWTKPSLVVTVKDLLAEDPSGSWLYAYFSLLDPDADAADLNFSTIGDHPYLYYVRLDNNGQDRVLYRRRLNLALTK
jgi:hypothetical protein